MALGDNYATLTQFKTYLGLNDPSKTSMDQRLGDALNAASREVEDYCHRQFNKTTEASPRTYKPDSSGFTYVDDFWTVEDLAISTDNDGAGVYGDPWEVNTYELLPRNGVVNGRPGWPYYKIRAAYGQYFPHVYGRLDVVQVTAQWGWAAVPAPVKQATLIIAAQDYKLADAPFGVAGFDNFGSVKVSDIPRARKMLCAYEARRLMCG